MSETLLGGRVVHAQSGLGHRTGIEPVLLAAAVDARPGQRVLEGGTGSGAALLCLAWRCPGIVGLGIEQDPDQAGIAAANVAANGFGGVRIVAGDLLAGMADGGFDHAMANPPWHGPRGTPSPRAAQDAARRAVPGGLAAWIGALARPLRHHGTLTLVIGAGCLDACLAGLAPAQCGSPAILPLWPKAGRAARLVLLRAVRNGRAACRVLPGLVLHEADGRFTATAEGVLRGGEPIGW